MKTKVKDVHILPIKDEKKHVSQPVEFANECWCEPAVVESGNFRFITHKKSEG